MRTSVLAPYCCYLRVYEPLAAFPERERSSWAAGEGVSSPAGTAGSGGADGPDGTQGADGTQSAESAESTAQVGPPALFEQRAALAALLPVLPPGSFADPQRPYTLAIDGVVLMCPDEPVLRMRRALAELMTDLPEEVLKALVPAGGLERVDFNALRDAASPADAVPHIMTARWHVPLVWFVIFGDDDRSVGMEPARGLNYRTPMVEARRRVGRAHRLLRRTRPDWDLGPLVRLGRWIEAFHPHSWVELDYGGLVNLMDIETLAADRSARDVTTALQAVAEGNDKEALIVYHRLRKRWQALRVKERAS
jgi:hypothetical protein